MRLELVFSRPEARSFRLDALIVPNVSKAVWRNSPFYGIEDQGWFLSYHVFTLYIKVTLFQGASLRPLPPGAGKD